MYWPDTTLYAGHPSGLSEWVSILVDNFGLFELQAHLERLPEGSLAHETPTMNRLAEQEIHFNSAYAQPLCSASRADPSQMNNLVNRSEYTALQADLDEQLQRKRRLSADDF